MNVTKLGHTEQPLKPCGMENYIIYTEITISAVKCVLFQSHDWFKMLSGSFKSSKLVILRQLKRWISSKHYRENGHKDIMFLAHIKL